MKSIKVMLVAIVLMICSIWIILFSKYCIRIEIADGVSLWLMGIGFILFVIAFLVGIKKE